MLPYLAAGCAVRIVDEDGEVGLRPERSLLDERSVQEWLSAMEVKMTRNVGDETPSLRLEHQGHPVSR